MAQARAAIEADRFIEFHEERKHKWQAGGRAAAVNGVQNA
jgi:hypothetical protein